MNFNVDQRNEIFIRELMNKDSFMFDWYAGAVIPKHHPRYYDGRIEVNIRKVFNSSYGNINFGRDKYQVNDEVVNNLYNYIETNIDKLIKISLNQSTEMYEGVSDSLRIKYKSIYISISEINAISDEEKEEIRNIKEDLKAILITEKEKRLESITFIDAKKIADRKDLEMNIEEKKEIAKRIYKELGFETDSFQIEKIEEINADIFLPTDNQRGIGGVIIGNDGSYHVCGSINPLQYYIDEYKNGIRDNMESNESLKLSNGKYAGDIETKQAFDGYMSKVDKYNEQVANGEKPDVKMGDLLNEYTDTFYDESLEEKMKKTEENFNNREKDTKIDDLINSVNEKLKDTEPPKFLKCPICGENLMYMQPDAITLYCRKCNKNFKNNNGTVGEEASYPYIDPNAEY
ncbi:MAG: hypothetical protein IKE73_02825 [Bacilli bacterium]|nr:hypothetical protein [Bacilli bacterium]